MEKRSLGISRCAAKGMIFLSGLFILCFLPACSTAEDSTQKITGGNLLPQGQETKEETMADSQKLNEQEGKYLLEVARNSIEQELFKDRTISQEDTLDSPKFSEKRGTFVTLTIDGNLRGCIGYIIPPGTLLNGIKDNALSAAFNDYRFSPLTKAEFNDIKVEISILTSPALLEYSDADDLLKKIRPDVDGVIIKKGLSQATFLPQVWEQLPDKREFFTHLCIKAGMDGNEWKKGALDVYTYQVQAFEEEE